MNKRRPFTYSFLTAAILAAATPASAAPPGASCSVEVNYIVNGTVIEGYTKNFVVNRDAVFVDDFSTATRQKRFTATLVKEGNDLVVSIDYFNDVTVFNAISLDTKLKLRGGRGIESTAGSHTFSSSQALPAGNHTTSHTLMCTAQ